jgi:hypothetical protein
VVEIAHYLKLLDKAVESIFIFEILGCYEFVGVKIFALAHNPVGTLVNHFHVFVPPLKLLLGYSDERVFGLQSGHQISRQRIYYKYYIFAYKYNH